jgi:hypothetical protein
MDPILAKYQELYQLSKEAVSKDIERLRRAEDKASKFASLSALLVTLSALAGKFVLDSFIPPKTILSWICLITYLLFLATLIYAFTNILGSMRVVTIDIPPMNAAMIEFFDKEEYIDIIYALAKKNCEILEKNATAYQKRLRSLLRTYKALLLSAILVSAFIVSFIFWFTNKPKGGVQICPRISTSRHHEPANHLQSREQKQKSRRVNQILR